MKKFLIMLVFVAAGLVANAQLFIGGGLGASFSGGNAENSYTVGDLTETQVDYSDKYSEFVISPTVGYMMSDNMGFGLNIGYANTIEKSCTDVEKKEFDEKTAISGFSFSPFFRYIFGDFGKIKLYADAKVPMAFLSTKGTYKEENTVVKEKGPKGFEIGFCIQPAFTYQFNEHISFNAELGLLSLGWSHTKVSMTDEGEDWSSKSVQKSNEFGIGVNTRVPVQFGFVYTF